MPLCSMVRCAEEEEEEGGEGKTALIDQRAAPLVKTLSVE